MNKVLAKQFDAEWIETSIKNVDWPNILTGRNERIAAMNGVSTWTSYALYSIGKFDRTRNSTNQIRYFNHPNCKQFSICRYTTENWNTHRLHLVTAVEQQAASAACAMCRLRSQINKTNHTRLTIEPSVWQQQYTTRIFPFWCTSRALSTWYFPSAQTA